MAVMLVYLLEPLGLTMEDLPDMGTLLQGSASLLGDQFQVYTRAPLILRQQLLFPYVHGLAFIKAALAHGGWPGLQRVYQHPPFPHNRLCIQRHTLLRHLCCQTR